VGNLIQTVAPEGVKTDLVDGTSITHEAINTAREAVSGYDDQTTPTFFPDHEFVTEYKYNSYGQLTSTNNPDQEGSTSYFYDRYGRIVASQNPEQAENNQYSYTFYDPQGRPVEVGQINRYVDNGGIPTLINPLDESITKAEDLGASFRAWVESGTRTEVTLTIYDEPLNATIEAKFTAGVQQHVRLRVASILYFEEEFDDQTDIETEYLSATHYSYDIHGNVLESLQDVPLLQPVEQDIKSTQYEFELISGNMEAVHYQRGKRDGYTHQYTYDPLNRLKEVYTTTDHTHYSKEAQYQYYDYGPLARVELGEYQVQGMDYAYTINGWIKAMNSNTLDAQRDMGKDSETGYYAQNQEIHTRFAKDVFGFTLNYFEGDYQAIGGSSFEAAYSNTNFGNGSANLYNGNIRHVVTAIEGLAIQGYAYSYDQLQRLTKMEVFRDDNLVANNNWNTAASTSDYLTEISYDKNGNILTLDRNGYGAELNMDRFAYNYLDINGEKSNRLDYVNDSGTDFTSYDDIKTGQATGNYTYNRIGELTEDQQEGMEYIWRAGDHKLHRIIPFDDDAPDIRFVYNPLGQRIMKLVRPRTNGVTSPENEWTVTFYGLDANSQVMAIYSSNYTETTAEIFVDEQYIYGSKRIGIMKRGVKIFENGTLSPSSDPIKTNALGLKRYELTNHLGSVNVTISDRKTWNSTDGIFEATVTNYAETYAFGMLMPGRSLNADGQRFLYHGMEQDPEIKGAGNSYTTEFRQYDPRLGRWKSLDALMFMFPHLSPYVGFDNNPIYFVDPYGLSSEKGDGGGGTPQDGDTRVHNGRHEVFAGGSWGADASKGEEVGVTASPKKMKITITKEYEEPGFWTRVGNWFRSVENQMKGDAKWSFGIELTTHDGKQQGNYEDASKAKKDAWTFTVYWDDIEDATTALKRLEKSLPKEFRDSPSYSGPDTFIEEAKKWIDPAQEGKTMSKQMEGKNRPKIKKQDSKSVEESIEKKEVVNHAVRTLPRVMGNDGHYYFEEERVVSNFYYKIIPVINGERYQRVTKEEFYEKTKK